MPSKIQQLADELDSRGDVDVARADEDFGYINFEEFPTNYWGPFKHAIDHGFVVVGINHVGDGRRLSIYFEEVLIDEESATFLGTAAEHTTEDDTVVDRFDMYEDFWYAPGSATYPEPDRDDAFYVNCEMIEGWVAPVTGEGKPSCTWGFGKVRENFGWSDDKVERLQAAWEERQ